MRFFCRTAFLLAGLSFGSIAGGAQNAIHAASTLAHSPGALPLACREQAAVLVDLLSRYPHPDRWDWVIVCDETEWRKFLLGRGLEGAPKNRGAFADFAREGGEEIYASTLINEHLTCVRGVTLLKPDSPLAQPAHVIAHELAHILLHTEDEDRAERQALRWLKERADAVVGAVDAERLPGQVRRTGE